MNKLGASLNPKPKMSSGNEASNRNFPVLSQPGSLMFPPLNLKSVLNLWLSLYYYHRISMKLLLYFTVGLRVTRAAHLCLQNKLCLISFEMRVVFFAAIENAHKPCGLGEGSGL